MKRKSIKDQRIETLENALRPFAEIAIHEDKEKIRMNDDHKIYIRGAFKVSVGDARKAHEILTTKDY